MDRHLAWLVVPTPAPRTTESVHCAPDAPAGIGMLSRSRHGVARGSLGPLAAGVLAGVTLWCWATCDPTSVGAASQRQHLRSSALLVEAAAICGSVAPEAEGLTLAVQPSRHDCPVLGQQVVATDGAGHDAVTVIWNADTGELLEVSHDMPACGASSGPVLSRDDATQAAWRWMEAIGVSRCAEGWRVAEAPVHHAHRWATRWHTPSRDALLIVDDRTGHLVMFLSHAPDTGMHSVGR